MSTADFDEYIRGKWFAPITDKLQAFENETDMFPEIGAIAEPDSPEWALNCAMKAIKPFGDLTGLPFAGEFGARQVGAMVGAKSSICAAMAASHKAAKVWPPKSRQKFVDAFGIEGTKYAEAVWRKFAEELYPKFEKIRRFASNLAMKQSYFEDVEFVQGHAKGMTFMRELRKTIRNATTKAEEDGQKRVAVYFFAVSCAETIEANRTELSWPALSEGFNETFEHKIAVDEDALKKILQRCGLRVGKPGRRVEVKI